MVIEANKGTKGEAYTGSTQNTIDSLKAEIAKATIYVQQAEKNRAELIEKIVIQKKQLQHQSKFNEVLKKLAPEAYYKAVQSAFPDVDINKIPEQYRIKPIFDTVIGGEHPMVSK